mgnify:CR=1 FL=1
MRTIEVNSTSIDKAVEKGKMEKEASDKAKSLLKSGLILSLMTLASRIMGLVREMTRATFLGTSMYSDAFTTSFMIPNLLRRLFAENSISVAFIPTFKSYIEKNNTEDKNILYDKTTLDDYINVPAYMRNFKKNKKEGQEYLSRKN